MTNHTISPRTGVLGAYSCDCEADLPDLMSAELHASETNQCTVCLGSAEQPVLPGLVPGILPGLSRGLMRPCTACAATGRRREQIVWELAHAEAEQVITMSLVRGVVAEFGGPFHLSEVADAVRSGLGLPPGRLPVGPRVRDLLLRLQAAGEITMLSAPDELLDGADVVLYRDPQWARTSGL
ncbi:hypothetical protein ACQP2T_33520 [Nonomuraea sp. CA-143628]|uniref:hypothetical protein n=1 Tax=Nonomuraea sp. CA-143628 TaxID=3239997 RepID=UPI003D8BEB69